VQKRCCTCGKRLPKGRVLRRCRTCHNDYMGKWRLSQREELLLLREFYSKHTSGSTPPSS